MVTCGARLRCAVPTTCMHFSKAFTALIALEEGKAVGRLVLTPQETAA